MITNMYEVKLKSYNEGKKQIKRSINNSIKQHRIENLKIYSVPAVMALSTVCIGTMTSIINPVVAVATTTIPACGTVGFMKFAKDNTSESKSEIKRLKEEKERLLSLLDKPTDRDKTIMVEYSTMKK